MIRTPDTVFIGAEGGAALHQGIGGDLKLFLIGEMTSNIPRVQHPTHLTD